MTGDADFEAMIEKHWAHIITQLALFGTAQVNYVERDTSVLRVKPRAGDGVPGPKPWKSINLWLGRSESGGYAVMIGEKTVYRRISVVELEDARARSRVNQK